MLIAIPAEGAVIINWGDASVVVTNTTDYSATVTGNTQSTAGEPIYQFQVTITTTGSTNNGASEQFISRAAPLGGIGTMSNPGTPLNLELTDPRRNNTQMSVTIQIVNRVMVNPSFTFLDIDTSNGGSYTPGSPGPGVPPYSEWQDEIDITSGTNATVTMTSVNSAVTTVNNRNVIGIRGNVGNSNNYGNVNVSMTGNYTTINYLYTPGPNDGFGGNQRHGLSNISIGSVLVPEPGTVALLGLVGVGSLWFLRRTSKNARRVAALVS